MERNRVFGRTALTVALGALFLALALHSVYWLGVVTGHELGQDFHIYYGAVQTAQEGGNPYLPYRIGSSFVYHPFALSLISLCALAQQQAALLGWMAVGALAWVLAVILAGKLVALTVGNTWGGAARWRLVITLLLLFAPFWETLQIGQINTLVVLCLVLHLYLAETDRDLAAGLALALAVALKTSPALFLLLHLVLGRYRLVAVTLGALLLLTVIAALQFGPQVVGEFAQTLGRLTGEVHPSAYNESILSAAARAAVALGRTDAVSLLVQGHRLLGAAGVGLVLWSAWRARRNDAATRLDLYALLTLCMVFFSPLVWYHHSVYLLVPLLALVARHHGHGLALALGAMALIQTERLFEQVVVRLPLPVLAAHILLLAWTALPFIARLRPRNSVPCQAKV
ncbi:MAG: glycosyltransferase family 87 protein [Anaerolineae bacterium]